MKTLLWTKDLDEIRRRFNVLDGNEPARWGLMTVDAMVWHVRSAFELALGRRVAAPLKPPIPGPVLKWLALRAPMQWPKGVPTVPELKHRGKGVFVRGFAAERAALLDALETFAAERTNCRAHAIFGAMKPRDWMRWGYLHTDHHLRQFGR